MEDAERPIAAGTLTLEEVAVETSLRPRSLAEYIGQQSVKQNLETWDFGPEVGLAARGS